MRGVHRALLGAAVGLGLGLSCARPEMGLSNTAATPPMLHHKVAILVHGYISDAGEFAGMAERLSRGDADNAPLHLHRFDYSQFSRVGYDHNLGVERLGEALGEAVAALRTDCPVCAGWADDPVDVTLVGRSFGGYVVREALLQDVESTWGGWEVDRVVTMASPLYGSALTRYSTGFLSVIINGGIRTVIYGFVNPERGGAFGKVIDAQIRAMRLGSPYQLEVHDRFVDWLGEDFPPPWLVITALGSRDVVRQGDGVARMNSANIAPLFPTMGVETVPVVVKHKRVFAGEPHGDEGDELERALRAVRHFIDRGTVRGTEGLERHALTPTGCRPAGRSPLPEDAVAELWMPPDDDPGHERVDRKLRTLVEADIGDVWLRFYDGLPGLSTELRPIELSRRLSPLQSSPEWSRRWLDLELSAYEEHAGANVPGIIAVGPVGSRHVFLPDVTPSGEWTVGLDLVGHGPVDPALLRVVVNGQFQHSPSTLTVAPLRNNVVDVYLDGETLRASQPSLRSISIDRVHFEPVSD